jgi:outer membrane protein assembly factor BamB
MAWAGEEGNRREGLVMVQRVKFDDAFHVVVVDDHLYFGSSVDHRVYCLRVADGRQEWAFCTGGPVRLAPTVGEDRVWFGSDDGYAYCLEARTGRLLWKVRAAPAEEWLLARGEMISRWPVRTGVLVDRGVAYFGAGIFPHENVYLCAVDCRDGRLLWKQDAISESNFDRNDLSPQGHLLLQGDMLYVPSGRTLPALVDRRDGRVLQKPSRTWRFAKAGGGDIGGSEALLADAQIYSFGAREIFAMDGVTGKLGFAWFVGQQMVVDRDSAYVATGADVRRLNRGEHAEASRRRDALDRQIYTLMAPLRDNAGSAKKLDAQTWATINGLQKKSTGLAEIGVVWKTPCPENVTLMGAGNVLFVGGRDSVAALDTASGKELWRHAVEGNARELAAAADCLWVSTSAGKVYCFGATGREPGAATVLTPQNSYPADPDAAACDAAREILRCTGVSRGYCLVLGSGRRARLAYELARQSELKIYVVEPVTRRADEARQALSAAGLYGTRVVVHCVPLDAIPYSNYFANLIVPDCLSPDSRLPDAAKVVRHLKPCGGVLCIGRPVGAGPVSASTQSLTSWLASARLGAEGQIRVEGSRAILVRGPLPDAGCWTHQYGEPGNSACGDDRRVRGDLGVLWYGEPGPEEMVNRHNSAVAPLAMDGRFFIQGERKILAYDAYNGLFLWQVDDLDASRRGTGLGYNPGNLAGGDGRIFVVASNRCRELDATTGRELAVHRLPPTVDTKTFGWQYVAYLRGTLVGTAVQRRVVVDKARRRGLPLAAPSDVLFAIDTRSGRMLWTYTGHSIVPSTVAVAPDHVFFIDNSLTDRERDVFLRQDKRPYQQLSGEAMNRAEADLKKIDVRRAVALDLCTGAIQWSHAVDVTDCSQVGSAAGRLTLMHHDDVLVLCGANGNGHYWAQFLAGEFKRRRLVALNAEDGRLLWARDANYRSRPIIVEQRVIAEPWAFDLRTGQQQTRPNVFTGEPVPWSMLRPGHHCGALSACPHMLTFRSYSVGYYNLDDDFGTQHFAGQRPGCWINLIPANGLAIMPEASAGCVCLFSVQCTTVLEPRLARRPWGIASCVGPQTPVRHLALHLGAPGDRRDEGGTLWLAYPRPTTKNITGLDIIMDFKPRFLPLGGYRGVDSEDHRVSGTDKPWLFTSWAQGLKSLTVPLLGPADGPAQYDVKLYFAELAPALPGSCVFDVKLQGKTVLSRLDVGAKPGTAMVREIRDVAVTESLLVELSPCAPNPSAAQMPVLSALEVLRRD